MGSSHAGICSNYLKYDIGADGVVFFSEIRAAGTAECATSRFDLTKKMCVNKYAMRSTKVSMNPFQATV